MIAGDPDTVGERVQALEGRGHRGLTASRCRTATTSRRSRSRARRCRRSSRGAGRDCRRERTSTERVAAIAELAVGIGANVQPGQIVGDQRRAGTGADQPRGRGGGVRARREVRRRRVLRSARQALAAQARARARRSAYVPPWIGERIAGARRGRRRADRLPGADRAAPVRRHRSGTARHRPAAAHQGVDRSWSASSRRNWCIVPFPTPDWATLVHPDIEPEAAYERLWQEIERILRLDEPDPVAAWETRLAQLGAISDKLNELRLDHLRYSGPGTDLTVGLFPGSTWISGRMANIHGITFTREPSDRGDVHGARSDAGRRRRDRHQAAADPGRGPDRGAAGALRGRPRGADRRRQRRRDPARR